MDSDEEVECAEVNLGFVEPPRRPTDVLRHRFPSKVGGRPAWLEPLHLPTSEQLTCQATGRPLQFLLQVYAPVDTNPAAFHRSIFIFSSPQGDRLAERGAVRAYRCQMPRANRFYSPEPPGKGDARPPRLAPDDEAAALERDPWRVAQHEQQAGGGGGGSGGGGAEGEVASGAPPPPRLFPELELLVEPEGEDEGGPGEDKLRELVQQYKRRAAEEGEYTEEELPGEVVDSIEANLSEEQRHFAAFSARIARDPSQCLRYCFDRGAAPLWPSPKRVPGPGDVPPCERCGAERWFEFQIMPQLLNYLDLDASDPAAPDWGTIAVYTCSASCGGGAEAEAEAGGGSAYQEEFVWVQPS